MRQVINRHRLAASVILLGVVVAGLTIWSWWHYVYSHPKRVFERMLASSLSTPSVTKQISESGDGRSVQQATQLSINPSPSVRSLNTLEQTDSKIVTETIAFPTVEYVRYNSIKTEQKTVDGDAYDFASIIGVWGMSSDNSIYTGGAQLFDQTLLGVVPIASLQPADRKALLRQIEQEQVYHIDFSSVQQNTVNGRPVYTYHVSLNPRAYVNMLKTFSRLVGNDELAEVDVAEYPESPRLEVELSVDVWSGQLRTATFADSQRVEQYRAHGARHRVKEPTDAISLQELQMKLQQLN